MTGTSLQHSGPPEGEGKQLCKHPNVPPPQPATSQGALEFTFLRERHLPNWLQC